MRVIPGVQRLFLAVFPPSEALSGAQRVIDALREPGDRVGWVRRANLHYTLRFLGDSSAEDATAAAEAARETAGAHAPFEAALGAPGAFPSPARARVLWLGLAAGAPELHALAKSLEDALVARGFPRADQPFAPHLTIGRDRAGGDWSAKLAAAPLPGARFRVDRVALVSSTLAPGGSRYVVIREAALGGG